MTAAGYEEASLCWTEGLRGVGPWYEWDMWFSKAMSRALSLIVSI